MNAVAPQRLHLVALPHTSTLRAVSVCAYTSKVVKFARMMTDAGCEVILYSGERNDAPCLEHVPVFSDREQQAWYGDARHDPNLIPSIQDWDASREPWQLMNHRTAEAIKQRRRDRDDLLLIIAGMSQRPISQAIPDMQCAEWGIGYEGCWSDLRCFESYCWQHFIYSHHRIPDGRAFDRVIPNFFDADEFQLGDTDSDDPFLLFVGRHVYRKGVTFALDIARAVDARLVMAGPGVAEHGPGRVLCNDGSVLEHDRLEYVGTLNPEQRSDLMGRAAALVAPTLYIEPFGGVAVEAMLTGTPVIATDWGAFTETVQPEVGRRIRTLADGVRAARHYLGDPVDRDGRERIREHALARYSLDAVAPMFLDWFAAVRTLWGDGWYALPPADEPDMMSVPVKTTPEPVA